MAISPIDELEAALLANPEDSEAMEVYGDALLAAGDLRGELAAIQRERARTGSDELARAEAAFLTEHGETLLGILGGHRPHPRAQNRTHRKNGTLGIPGYQLTWEHGHVRSIVAQEPVGAVPDAVAVLSDLLTRPAAQFVTEISIEEPEGFACERQKLDAQRRWRSRGGDVLDVITSSPRPALRSLRFGRRDISFEAIGDDDFRTFLPQANASLGDLTRLWRAAPNLRELRITGCELGLGELDLPELRRFELRTSSLKRQHLAALARARLPALESLVLLLWAGEYGEVKYGLRDVAPLCDPKRFPSLRHLGLICSAETDDVAAMLLDSPLLPQLATLDLRGGAMRTTDALVRGSKRLSHLESLDLRWNSLALPDPTLADALPRARIDPQEWAHLQIDPRYTAIME